MTREEFMRLPNISAREKRGMERGWNKREDKLRRTFKKRGSYLSNRIYELTTQKEASEQLILRLDNALSKQDLVSLFAPRPPPSPVEDGEGAGDSAWREDEESGQAEEISTAQAN